MIAFFYLRRPGKLSHCKPKALEKAAEGIRGALWDPV
jgi:hypothetical protein|eukprot:COSAG06_NODE_5046_length_3763_cov_1.612991_2_plen_37_part_00